jgi:CO/xanthine dehydrogenase Mo-binding subunit
MDLIPFKVLGTRPIRHDGTDKVTGRAQYGADFQMAGLLHGESSGVFMPMPAFARST